MSSTIDTQPSPAGSAGGLFSGYLPPVGAFDEMLAPQGTLRPHCQKVIAAFEALGADEINRRWEQARRNVNESGITFNVYGDPHGGERPWDVDALPLVFSPQEWQSLEAGLIQRARLLNMLLVDLYGPQKLLFDGLLPPEFIYAHPGYLLPCHNSRVPQQCYLHLYGAHLARAADGGWVVLADKTQGPSGAGYAVESRILLSRTFPEVFHDAQVQRLAAFFMTLRETLPALATHHHDNPRIAVLTPGPRSSNYFEDAYLSRYLGYTLVEGGDLTVRDNCVYLKTLGGLLPVDVLLRRMADDECDPLELRGDSLIGVPGLVQAARSSNVVVANALGSGLLEAPALMAFLPGLCRSLLGEELQLPCLRTWWCGNPQDLAYVTEHLGELVLRPALPQRGFKPVMGALLSADDKTAWLERLRARPRDFVAQEQAPRSTAPVWTGREMQPAFLGLKTFLVATGDTYDVMPGGLARVSSQPEELGESLTPGQGSKDVWVLSEGPVTPVSLLRPAGAAIELRRSGNDLPSRVADNLFWLGRHVERAEGAVRLLRSIVVRLTSELEVEAVPELAVLLQALADQGQIRPEFALQPSGDPLPGLEAEILAFVFDDSRSGSLRRTLNNVHQVASIVRDRISIDSWRILNQLDRDVLALWPEQRVQLSDVLSMLNQMVIHLAAFAGLGMESMTRGPGWRFLDMGRRTERALHTMSLLRSALASSTSRETQVLEALLEIADSSMTYRSRYLTTLQLPPLLDLLLTDESNPRSVAFQLVALDEHVENLPRMDAAPLRTGEQRIMLTALTALQLADVNLLCEAERDGSRKQLDRFLARLSAQLRQLSETITHTYLVHAGPSRQLGEILPGRHV